MEIKSDYIVVYAMGFYGNKTLTRCYEEEDIDNILTGFATNIGKEETVVNKRIAKLPQTECYVVYDGGAEIKSSSKLVCSIPEQNIKIYDRCLFCRKDGDELKSLLPEDIEYLNQYIVD